MKKVLFTCAAIALALVAISFVSCGVSSPCQDLLYKICDCESDKKTKDSCYAEVDKSTFSAEADTECSKYKDTCTCDTYKDPEKAKTACGDPAAAGLSPGVPRAPRRADPPPCRVPAPPRAAPRLPCRAFAGITARLCEPPGKASMSENQNGPPS